MVFQAEERTRVKKQRAGLAVQLALQGRWAQAVQVNKAILESFPTDVDAYNRLGKALTELSQYEEARGAYEKSLEVDELNSIARKNLARLATLGKGAAPRAAAPKLAPEMFIEEMGKTSVTTLVGPAGEVLGRLANGDEVQLHQKNGSLVVKTPDGTQIGAVEPRLAQRLSKLIRGGNRYAAAIWALQEGEVRVFIRETFQDASLVGRPSFPPTVGESVRPYVKDRLLRQDTDDVQPTIIDEDEDVESGHKPTTADAVATEAGSEEPGDDEAEV
jgi:hypothetical protein